MFATTQRQRLERRNLDVTHRKGTELISHDAKTAFRGGHVTIPSGLERLSIRAIVPIASCGVQRPDALYCRNPNTSTATIFGDGNHPRNSNSRRGGTRDMCVGHRGGMVQGSVVARPPSSDSAGRRSAVTCDISRPIMHAES